MAGDLRRSRWWVASVAFALGSAGGGVVVWLANDTDQSVASGGTAEVSDSTGGQDGVVSAEAQPSEPPDVGSVGMDRSASDEADDQSRTVLPASGDVGAPGVVPPGAAFVESFDGNPGADRLDFWVFQRNVDLYDYWDASGGRWSGDHDTNCGSPDSQRELEFKPEDAQPARVANAAYVCRDHVMTSMGDVDGYSIVAFKPQQTFDTVSSVSFDVNLTDLGARKWWKVGVVSAATGWEDLLYSDVEASDLPGLTGDNRLIASWGGPGAYPAKLRIGDSGSDGPAADPAPSDKATRYPVELTDNADGTITFEVAGTVFQTNGSFPQCPCQVVLYDHSYTPDKDGPIQGHTWHWDNIVVKA